MNLPINAMREPTDTAFTATIRQTHIDLRSLYLPGEFIKHFDLVYGTKYPIRIEGAEAISSNGTLQATNWMGGMAKLFRNFDLVVNDEIGLDFEDGVVVVIPPSAKAKTPVISAQAEPTGADQPSVSPAEPVAASPTTVFARQKLKHIHIPDFAPANLVGWNPETETDIYLVFGMLSENTDFRFCCGASKALIKRLGYVSDTKPDAILIDRSTDEYLMAEFKMNSSDFTSNHNREDVDVLVCWLDDESDRSKLPERVVGLKDLREKAVKAGKIELDELS